MGNGTSRVVGCFVPFNAKNGVDLEFLEPLDEGLGHSFCYVRPTIFDSPAITPSNSERFTLDSSTLDSETLSGSFRHDIIEEPSGFHRITKNFPETTFKTISGASVSANVSTARTGNQTALFGNDVQEPSASFESTSSFAAIPLQPIPRGSGPLNGFMSGPLERGFASGPLDKGGGGFMSGPIEKGVMSGPLDDNNSNFSAPLTRGRRRPRLQRLVRSVSGPMKSTFSRTFSKHSVGSGWMHRLFLHPVTQTAWYTSRECKASRKWSEGGVSEGEYVSSRNLQWAHGKAGEDRVHVVLSEEQGWLFIGIYDGFSGPDAPEFLMSHLYRAIDKELEGLLWDYDDKSENTKVGTVDPALPCGQEVKQDFESCREASYGFKASCNPVNDVDHTKKSITLYELLQMEPSDEQRSKSCDEQRSKSCDGPKGADVLDFRESLNTRGDSLNHLGEDPSISGISGGSCSSSTNQVRVASPPVSERREITRQSSISSKIRKLYQKQKSLRKKLLPWRYDWHREEEISAEDRLVESSGLIRRCKSGITDHNAVISAMAKALECTEDAYMEMVEKSLDTNPELALMGSCVLVMLMKDQDVYVMNLGDSRVVLAQERQNDRHSNVNFLKDDVRHGNRSRESLVRMELDMISEESPVRNQTSYVHMMNKKRDIAICRLKMRAVQLSTDHSTSVEEEVLRIKAEHPDDNQAITNDRTKGQLKVTRAFGAGFLKKPTCNESLLEMFRIDYIGTAPYLSCDPSVLHHRLTSSDRFLVLSSDGLYQFFSNEEVVAHVTWFMENVPEGDPAQYLIAELLFRAAKKNGMNFHELLDIPNGDRRKYHDDVSVMVVSLEGRIWRSSG